MRLLLVTALCLAGCDRSPAPAPANQAAGEPASPVQPTAPPPFTLEEKTDLYEFDFAWPAEVSAIPALAARLKSEMEKTRAELVAGAKEDRAWRAKDKLEYHPHSTSVSYEAAGQSARLLSLRVDAGGYSGGAHGNSSTSALLWDREAGREIGFADLFAQSANRDRLLTQRWCDAINRAREEKRGTPVSGNEMFDECPPLDDIAIIPADRDKDGRFERLLLVASPYVAGPWAEGEYEVELTVTPELTAGFAEAFRPSFSGQGAQ